MKYLASNKFLVPLAAFAVLWLAAGCKTTPPKQAAAPAAVIADSAITAAEMAAVFEVPKNSALLLESRIAPEAGALMPKDLLCIAAEKNPSFAEYAAAREAALAEVMAASTWQNPTLELGAGRGKTRGTPSSSGFEYSIGLFQPIEWPGKRGVRKEAATVGVKVAELDEALFRSTLRADVLRAYWGVCACDEQVQFAKDLVEVASDAVCLVVAQVEAGELNASVLLSRQSALQDAKMELVAACGGREVAFCLLRRLCGGKLSANDCVYSTLLDGYKVHPDVARELALKKHPAILKLEAERRRAELAIKQAELATRPDLTPGVEFNRGVDVTSWAGKLAAALPFWNRNKAGVAVAMAELHRVEAQLAAKRIEVVANVEAAALEYANAAARREAAWQVRGLAEESVEATMKLVEAGEADSSMMTEVRRKVKLAWHEVRLARLAGDLAQIQLEQAIGYGELK